MPSQGAITKTIRINREDRAYLEEEMAESGLTWSGVIHKLISERGTPPKKKGEEKGTPQKQSNVLQSKNEGTPLREDLMDIAVERDLKQMCKLSQISTHDFFRGINDIWERGQLEIEGHKVRSTGIYDVSKLEEECYKRGIKPQSMIDKVVRSLQNA